MSIHIHRAVQSNFSYLPIWQSALNRILPMIGFTNMCPSEYQFAEAVARWQRDQKPPLQADGILGPLTWSRMQQSLRASHTALPVRPRADLRNWGPQSFAPAMPGRTPIDHDLLNRNRQVEQALFSDAKKFLDLGDLRWFFTLAHAHITRQINANLALFQRPNALLRLNLHFSEEFLRAINGQASVEWQSAFQFCASLQRGSVNNPALVGAVEFCGARMANVHIHIDLSRALNEVGCIPPEDYANVLVFVNRGALAATVELRGKFLGVSETMASQLIAPAVNLDVKAWRNAVYQKTCNAVVPDPESGFRPVLRQ
jgi:hypothetical protein